MKSKHLVDCVSELDGSLSLTTHSDSYPRMARQKLNFFQALAQIRKSSIVVSAPSTACTCSRLGMSASTSSNDVRRPSRMFLASCWRKCSNMSSGFVNGVLVDCSVPFACSLFSCAPGDCGGLAFDPSSIPVICWTGRSCVLGPAWLMFDSIEGPA